MNAVTADPEAPDAIPWRTGTWSGAVTALKQLRSAHDDDVAYWSAVQAWADSLTITQEFAARRVERVAELAAGLVDDSAGSAATATASRYDLIGSCVLHLSRGIPVAHAAVSDPLTANRPSTVSELAQVRAVTLGDLMCIFDFEPLARAAKGLALLLLHTTGIQRRFDDALVARRFIELHSSLAAADDPGRVELAIELLRHFSHDPAISTEAAQQRIAQVPSLCERIERTEDLRPDVANFLQAVRTLDVNAIEIDTERPNFVAECNRLAALYASGSSVGHLDDLIAVCAARREGAGRQAEAARLNWLARFRYERGRILHSTDDFQAAVETQRMAVELLEESDPNRDGCRRSVVEYQLAEIAASDGSFRPLLASIRNDLPPLPPPSEIEDEDEDETGAAYAIRALVELLAALEAAPAERAELVADAFASAAVAKRLLPPGKDQYDDELAEIEACARVLEAIHKNTEIAEKDLQTLAVAVAQPHFFTRSRIAAIRTLRTAIERSEPARHSLGVTLVDTDSDTRH